MSHGYSQPPQQKPGIEIRLSRKACGRPSYLIAWTSVNHTGGPTRLLKILYQYKHCQLGFIGTETKTG